MEKVGNIQEQTHKAIKMKTFSNQNEILQVKTQKQT